MNDRFVDDGCSLHELVLEPVDVRCPKCEARARLVPLGDGEPELHMARRMSCFECGFTRDHNGKTLGFARVGEDPCFGYPLWYRTETPKGRIWAYHRSHIEEMRAYIAASNRDRSHLGTWKNRGYLTRLPRWIRSAKHRDLVVKAIDRMLSDA